LLYAEPFVHGFGPDFETQQAGLLVSDDGGRQWAERTPAEGLISLAIDPHDRDQIVVSGEESLYLSSDAGGGWRPLDGSAALLGWPEADSRRRSRARARTSSTSPSTTGLSNSRTMGAARGRCA
jgi:hypothetical protein